MNLDTKFVTGIQHHFSDGVYAKQMTLTKGSRSLSHKHNYDHLSILATGSVTVVVDGKAVRYIAPACINVKKGVSHGFVADSEDATFFCVHHTFETDPDKVDSVLIKRD